MFAAWWSSCRFRSVGTSDLVVSWLSLAPPSHEPLRLWLRLRLLLSPEVLWLGMGAHAYGWVAGIAGHGSITQSRDWLAGLQWKPLDISQVSKLCLANDAVVYVSNTVT